MSGSMELDVLVIGGGPAGSVCATLLAQQGVRVAVVEASDFTRFRIGETIAPVVRSILGRVGLPTDSSVPWGLPYTGIGSVWGSPTVHMRPTIVSPYGRGWRVDRRAFDRM